MESYIKNIGGIHFIRKLNETQLEAKKIQKIINSIMKSVPARIFPINKLEEIKEYSNPIIITIGGDGTALFGMKLSAELEVPVLTINLGRLGFLADIDPQKITTSLYNIFRGDFILENRLMLESLGSIAANEFYIGPQESGQLFRYKIYVDGILASKQQADGVIISTPTGSTGYAMSAGGALIAPEMRAIQIIPVSAHTLSSRPLVVKFDKRISVTFEKQQGAILKSDGQKIKEFRGSVNIDINSYSKPAIVIHPKGWNFYRVLAEKLNWDL